MKISITYYAVLREQSGQSDEEVETQAGNARDLYLELQTRHGFSLSCEQLKVAINDEFSDWTALLSDGDTVVFIPPVAGG